MLLGGRLGSRGALHDRIGLLPRPRTWLEVVTGKAAARAAGVYVGGWEDEDGTFHYLRHNGPEHVLTYAPTRSGKGVGVVIPNLLEYEESVVVLDIKQENYELTSGWRAKQGQEVFLFNPFAEDRRSHRWNPLSKDSSLTIIKSIDLDDMCLVLLNELMREPYPQVFEV